MQGGCLELHPFIGSKNRLGDPGKGVDQSGVDRLPDNAGFSRGEPPPERPAGGRVRGWPLAPAKSARDELQSGYRGPGIPKGTFY